MSKEIRWSIRGIGAGSYRVVLAADVDGDEVVGEGDQGGYYGGTTEQPVQLFTNATVLDVTSSLGALDFGIGWLKCKAEWGEACETSADCGLTRCPGPASGEYEDGPSICTEGICVEGCERASSITEPSCGF